MKLDGTIVAAHGRQYRVELTSGETLLCFPRGNLAPEGAVIKSTAIDPAVVDADGVYRKTGPARVFTRERDAVAAIKHRSRGKPWTRPELDSVRE